MTNKRTTLNLGLSSGKPLRPQTIVVGSTQPPKAEPDRAACFCCDTSGFAPWESEDWTPPKSPVCPDCQGMYPKEYVQGGE
jgi:hypothetical protein